MAKAFTDTIFQQIKVYIEGVEVPFLSLSITSGIGGLPTAQISVPPQAGLMDIARFYQPKVHIFYEDRIGEYKETDTRKRYKLLFSGIIAQVGYLKSKDVGSTAAISFNCQHKYSPINDMLLDYTGWLTADPLSLNDSEATKLDSANSTATIIDALAGIKDPTKSGGSEITPQNPNGQSNILPEKYRIYYTRLLGIPGIAVNIWNQIKRSAFNRKGAQGNLYYSEAFVKMWQPLTEDGLQFFDRMGGHYPIEAMVQADEHRADPCPETPNIREKIVIPPSRQMFLTSSVQAELTVSNVSSYLQNSGEVTSIYQLLSNFYESIDYEIVTLASPAEVAIRQETTETQGSTASIGEDAEKTHALDSIIKPKIPFYFSPTCNVLFPGMYRKIEVNYDEINIPSRINLKNLETRGLKEIRTNFRAPPSIREAIAAKVAGVNGGQGYNPDAKYSLSATLGDSYGAIGIFEQGRGIKQESGHLPRWLSHFSYSTLGSSQPLRDQVPSEPAKNEALEQLAKGWAKRFPGDQSKTLNPYAPADSDISGHQRMVISAADYYYTQVFARSKMGSVDCLFNPYIVPGYPMDILEANPIYPSFHAMCNSVTHFISGDSCSTQVTFVAAMTYSEMANYYIPFIGPMLQVALGLAETPTMTGIDQKARTTADEFYKYTLGVNAVVPEELLDFETMVLKPKKWADNYQWTDGSSGSITDVNGGERNPALSFEGNLSLVYRNIESQDDIEYRYGVRFIDMDLSNYNNTVMKYKDKRLTEQTRYEIGASQFLTYDTYFGDQIQKQNVTTTSSANNNIIIQTDNVGGASARRDE